MFLIIYPSNNLLHCYLAYINRGLFVIYIQNFKRIGRMIAEILHFVRGWQVVSHDSQYGNTVYLYAYCTVRMISLCIAVVGGGRKIFLLLIIMNSIWIWAYIICSKCPPSARTDMKTLAPLLDCVIDNCLIKLRPLLNETSLQMVHVMNPHTIHSFLKHSPDFVIDGVEVGTVGWPQCWWDEIGRLSLEHCYGVVDSVGRCTILLEE